MSTRRSLLLGLFAGSVMPVAARATEQAAATTSGSEVERFCSNIADAARDRRYQIQAQELATLQADIDKRIAALEEKRKEYEAWLQRQMLRPSAWPSFIPSLPPAS
jgi:flagellar motility protein MotE (MotC chaperone)